MNPVETSRSWPDSESLGSPRLKPRDFQRLSTFIEGHCGIRMPPAKKIMLESRLRKRLRTLGLRTFGDYCDFALESEDAGAEMVHLIDAVTTNKTDFFREPQHFTYLVDHALPRLAREQGAGLDRDFRIWSAGCSSGEEPYTLAMVLAEFAQANPGYRFRILGTDICTEVLEHGRRAIYSEDRVDPIPIDLRSRYLLRSRSRDQGLVRIVPGLRNLVRFRQLNFLDHDFGLRELMDVVFCRNVFIYFDRPTQESILRRFCRHLVSGGYVFLGHSETINGLNVPLAQVAPTVYRATA